MVLWTGCLCPPKFLCCNPSPDHQYGGGAFGRLYLGREGRVFMIGISAPTKQTLGSSFSPSATCGLSEIIYEPGPDPAWGFLV